MTTTTTDIVVAALRNVLDAEAEFLRSCRASAARPIEGVEAPTPEERLQLLLDCEEDLREACSLPDIDF